MLRSCSDGRVLQAAQNTMQPSRNSRARRAQMPGWRGKPAMAAKALRLIGAVGSLPRPSWLGGLERRLVGARHRMRRGSRVRHPGHAGFKESLAIGALETLGFRLAIALRGLFRVGRAAVSARCRRGVVAGGEYGAAAQRG